MCQQIPTITQDVWWPGSHHKGGHELQAGAKAIIRHSNRRDFLLPRQFGFGSKRGVEPVVRVVERALGGTLARQYTHLTSLDDGNAFNIVGRRDIAEGLPKYVPALYPDMGPHPAS